MNEDYVSYEVAKLLKEKKFHWNCHVCYDPRSESKELLVQEGISNVCYSVVYAAPTLYMAQKWLRVEKDIHIMIDVCASGYYPVLWKTNRTFIKTLADKGPNDGGVWDTYEGALQAGILESLKLICQ